MSVQSAQNQQNPNFAHSHHNNLIPSMETHSALLQQHPATYAEHHEWVATYIDGQYFLTDPESMKKLNNIQHEIQQEQLRLAQLQNDNTSLSNSYISLQQENIDKESHKSFCNTQFNYNKEANKQEKVKSQLEREEDRYREKVSKIDKDNHQVKNTIIQTNQEEIKIQHAAHKIENQKQRQQNSPCKSSHKEQFKGQTPVQVEHSKKSVRRSIKQESKQKSHHKSRIQKSIKDNIEQHKVQLNLNNTISFVEEQAKRSKPYLDNFEQVKSSNLSAKNDDSKSKHSSKVEKPQQHAHKSSRSRSIKKDTSFVEAEQIKSKKSKAVQQFRSRKSNSIGKRNEEKSMKGSSHPNDISVTSQKEQKIDKSIQYSHVTDSNQQQHVNEIKFQTSSEKNSSVIQPNSQSMYQSSNLKLQILNNQLHQQYVQPIETPQEPIHNMKKKISNPYNQTQEKKYRSFIIHSRNGSVKERSEKNYDQINRSKFSENKSKKQSQGFSAGSATREEIFKLHQQIEFLRDKLKQIQERQQHIQKVEASQSKIHKNEQQDNIQPLPTAMNSPIIQSSEMSVVPRHHPKLQLSSSIIQVDTHEEIRKKLQKESEAQKKASLQEEVTRLKKIIKDMQIQKIKSIDQSNELAESSFLQKDSKNLSEKQSRVYNQKESIILQGISPQKRLWVKPRIQDAGRIIKNSNIKDDKADISPRRRLQLIKLPANQVSTVIENEDQTFELSIKEHSKFMNKAKQNSIIEKINQKQQDFHHFIESNRPLIEDQGRRQPITLQTKQSAPPLFHQFDKTTSHFSSPTNKINYSRLVQEFRKHNPEEEEMLPQINLRDITGPALGNTPTNDLNQDDLLDLAKSTYQLFGTNIDQEDKQLCVKKYKNCVVFSITTNPSQCILWHCSGKFYIGGWKAGQPGEGEKHGQGLQIVPQKHIYKGQFLNGKKNGAGVIKLANNNIYDGQWIDGIKNGRGVYLDAATGVIYSGEWKEGKKDGQGYLKLSEKQYYYGTFVKSVKEGFGVQAFLNGDKYKGQYKNGKFHGKGKYAWSNGSCYEGQFVEGVRQGQGCWKSAKTNGDIYIGAYQGDKKNGYGRYVWMNGSTYQGGFANDVKHGKGRLTYQDGKEVKGIWEEGNLINTQHEKHIIDHEDQPLRRSVKVNSFGGHRRL